MNQITKRRIIFLFCAFCAIFFVVIGKAFKVQVIDRDVLLERSKSQIFREAKIYPKRGIIYDRKNNPLALNIQTYSIFTIPKGKSSYDNYKKLVKIVPELDYQKIQKLVSKRKRYTWLARKISLSKEQVESIKKIKDVYIESVPKRLYPNHELAAQILGFVGVDNVGLAGIEYEMDKQLRGKPRVIKYVKDAKNRAIKFEGQEVGDNATDIHLTLDKDLQAVAEKALKDAVIEHKAIRGGIGVMNADNGEILAMANFPTFDPNEPGDFPGKQRKLSFISDPIEPGSVFKIFTVASALENKIAKSDTNYYCNKGSIVIEGHEINESDARKKYEWLSVKEIIKHSSNVGTTKIAFDLTYPKLRDTLMKFKFGEKTGINLPGESRGIYTSDKNVTPLSLSNISFGQGIATTGIQILSAYSVIANGGYLVKPRIVLSDDEPEKERIVSEQLSEQLSNMLVEAVEDGTGANAIIPYFSIAGKTSTAQRPSGKGGYDGYISGFVGFPMNIKNKFVIYVYVEKPEGSYYGNTVAAPVFKKVAQYILYKRKDFSGLALKKDSPLPDIDIVKQTLSSTRTKGSGFAPNFLGLDKKSSKQLASKNNVLIHHMGIGVVTKQHPEVGQPLLNNEVIKLYYKPPVYE